VKSPIKLECEWIIPEADAIEEIRKYGPAAARDRRGSITSQARKEFQTCKWVCRGPVKIARFSDRRRPAEFAIVHPATKAAGEWQVSYFDDQNTPWSDTRRKTCSEAVGLLAPWAWRLRSVK